MRKTADFLARHLPYFCLAVFIVAVTIGTFTGGLWASLGIGFALVMFMAVWRIEGHAPVPQTLLIALTLLMLGACALLNLQSSQPGISWRAWERLATIFLPLVLLANPAVQKHAASAKFFTIAPLAAALGAAALGLELGLNGPLLQMMHHSDAGLTQYNRGFSYLVIFVFPLMAGLWLSKRRWLAIPFILILLVPAGLTASRSAQLALALASATVFAAQVMPVATRRILAVLPFAAGAWVFVAQKLFLDCHGLIERLPRSWLHRMEIWDYMSYHILERPLLGWGLGTSSSLPFTSPHLSRYLIMTVPPPHPHNAFIQLWVELGLPGLACGIAFTLLMLYKAGRLRPGIAPFALGAWVAALCLAMTAYDLWSDSLWAVFALTGFAFALLQREKTDAKT